MAGNTSFWRRRLPRAARRGDPHGRPGLTSKNCDRSHTHTYTSKRVSHSHLTPWSPPSPLPDGPFKLPALGPARAPGNAGYSAFQHKKRRTKSRRACAEAALRAAATLYDRAKLRSSGRIVVSVLASRDRFEVLGVGGDINKSTTFGTEDKCNPFRSSNLSCAAIPNPAEPHGNRNRGGNRKCGQGGRGRGRCRSL